MLGDGGFHFPLVAGFVAGPTRPKLVQNIDQLLRDRQFAFIAGLMER